MKISHRPPAYGDTSNTLPLMDIPPLPKGATVKEVYVTFLAYLFSAARTFFENNTLNGPEIWKRLADQNVIVLTTPNGWDTTQHLFLQEAAIDAKLISREHWKSDLSLLLRERLQSTMRSPRLIARRGSNRIRYSRLLMLGDRPSIVLSISAKD